jgi:hypothetical protein
VGALVGQPRRRGGGVQHVGQLRHLREQLGEESAVLRTHRGERLGFDIRTSEPGVVEESVILRGDGAVDDPVGDLRRTARRAPGMSTTVVLRHALNA